MLVPQNTNRGDRPTKLIGHGWVLDYLGRSAARGRAHHAYLLTGPNHIGKLTTALGMAQVLMCQRHQRSAGPNGDSGVYDGPETLGLGCGVCRHCVLVERRIHPDLRLLQLPPDRRNIPIKDVHEFMQGIALKPLEAERKVYIVDSADMLAEDGANALLKTLEEPPPAVTLILTATDPARLLPTVVSRCQRIALRPAPTEAIRDALLEIEGTTPEAAGAIARASHGLPGWALLAVADADLLDERRAREADLAQLLEASRLERLRYADDLAERWSGHMDHVVSTLEIWIDRWREMARAEAVSDSPSGSTFEAAETPSGSPAAVPTAREGLAATLDALEALKANAHPRLTLENLLLFWPRLPGLERG